MEGDSANVIAEEYGEDVEVPADIVDTSVVTLDSKQFKQLYSEEEADKTGIGEYGEDSNVVEIEDDDVSVNEMEEEEEVEEEEEEKSAEIVFESGKYLNAETIQSQVVSALSAIDRKSIARASIDLIIPSSSWSVETLKDTSIKRTPTKRIDHSTTSFERKTKDLKSLPRYEIRVQALKPNEKYDAFSEDEEPVLRTEYIPYEAKEEGFQFEVKTEVYTTYDVRKGVPQPLYKPPFNIPEDFERLEKKPSKASLKRSSRHGKTCIYSENFKDVTPHQRDLFWISIEELTQREVMIIKGLWKCIALDLWTFGALVTINSFKIRGFLTNVDQKATPDSMMECRFFWPHANRSLKSLELVVMNLHKPTVCHNYLYEIGRKHSKSRIPFTEDLNQVSF